MKPQRQDFATHGEYSNARKRYVRKEKSEYISAVKAEKGCADCGIKNPVVLQFHHRNGKRDGVYVSQCTNILAVQIELAKCDILCANCHIIRHYKEMNDGQ